MDKQDRLGQREVRELREQQVQRVLQDKLGQRV
jgi:hypothetical protein